MKNRQTNRHKNPLFMRLIALALTCAMAVSASNVSVYAADMLGDSSASSSADASLDVSTGDSSTDPADGETGGGEQAEDESASSSSSGDASADSSEADTESTGAEDASAGEEENATEDTGDPAGEAEGDESTEAEAEAEAEIAVAAMEAEEDEGNATVSAAANYSGHIDVRIEGGEFEYTQSVSTSNVQDVTVTKVWKDGAENHTSDSVTVYVANASGTAVTKSVTLSASNNWSYTYEDLTLDAGDYHAVESSGVTGYKGESTTVTIAAAGSNTQTYTVKGELTLTGITNNTISYTHNNTTYTLSNPTTRTDTGGAKEYSFSLGQRNTVSDGDVIEFEVSYTATYTVTDSNGEVVKTVKDEVHTDESYKQTVSAASNVCAGNGYDFEVSQAELLSNIVEVDTYTITLTNTKNTGSLTLSKVVKADSSITTSGMSFTFYVSGFADGVTSVTDSNNKTYSVSNGVATVTVPAGDSVTLVDVPVGSYTVYETSGTTNTTVTANGYTWTVSNDDQEVEVTDGGTASATITNTITGEAVVFITKNWDDQSNKFDTRPDSITVTLTGTGTDGKTYEYSSDATDAYQESTNVWEFSIDGVEFFDENGQAITYTVTETLTYADGSTNYYTTEYSAEEIVPGKYISEDRNLTITNTLKTGSVSVSKSVETASSSTTDNTDVFTIGLVAYTYDETTKTYTRATDKDGNAITYTYTVSDEVGWSHVFSDLPLGYYWSISEWTTNDGGVHSYDMSLSIDGTDVSEGVIKAVNSSNNKWTNTYRYFYLDLESTTQGTAQVVISMTNTEEEISVDLSTFLKGTKTLTGDPGSDLTFNYTITHGDKTVATGESTVSANSESNINWKVTDSSAFVYSETGTYNYVITETVTNEAGIVFDSTRYTLIVTVSEDADDGHLIATVTMTKNVETASGDRETTNVTTTGGEDSIVVADYETNLSVKDSFSADFTNIYDADETSIIFRARKTLDGRTLSAGEFSVNVTEYTDENYTTTGDEDGDGYTTITRSNGADGNMGFEVVYETAGTYYYTVTENSGSKNDVKYDDTTYYIKVEVGTGTNASGESALQVKSAEYSTDMSNWASLYDSSNELIYLSFTNTYKDTATASFDNIASKTLTGRDLVEGEFTFLLVPEGTAGNDIVPNDATVATADDPYVIAGYVTVGQWYIETTNNADGGINFGPITYDQSQVGTYTYKVVEVVEDANGVTYDIGTTGKLIYVTVYYDSTEDDLLTSISTSGSGNETVTITNTYDPGTVDLYGTKVWVDGGLTHNNESEITLYVYSSTNEMNWTMVDSSTYTLTWFANGDWHIAGSGLTEFDSAGNKLYYMVSEASVSGYTTTYSTTDGEAGTIPEDNSSTNRYTITNTIEQEYMTISGTKTWVEPTETEHDNAAELVLTVTRNSESLSSAEPLTQVENFDLAKGVYGSFDNEGEPVDGTYIVVWTDDAYNIYWYYDEDTQDYVGLPVYDASGYTYYYNVEEKYADDYQEKYANYTVETDWELVEGADNAVTFDFTNRAPDDDEEQPVKTETTIGTTTPTGKLNGETVTEETALTSGDTVTYNDVAVGDTITYSISYYNNANTSATITITDVLDRGLTFVSASPNSYKVTGETTVTETKNSTWNYGGTITWTLTVDAFASGSVTVTAKVNSNARTISSGETAATVDNQATVYNAETGHTATTNIVTNPLEDDPDKETEKGIISVTYYEDGETTQSIRDDRDDDGNGNIIVQEGDQIHYIISRYNNTDESVTFVIVDTLDEGVTYANSSPGSTYYNTDATVTVNGVNYSVPAHSVVWVVSTNPFSTATVQMTVTVNSAAKTAEQTYTAFEPGTYGAETDNGELDANKDVYDSYTYGTNGDTTASVANQAVAYTVGNDVVSYSNVIENPLDDDDPVAPTKTEPRRTATDGLDSDGNVEDTNGENGISDETVEYEAVGIGAIVEYEISYYNHNNTAATVTITDTLDKNVRFVDASGVTGDAINDDGKANTENYVTYFYNSSTHTITWTIYNAKPLTGGTVEMQVQVLSAAGDAQSISNQASVKIGNDAEVSTNTVKNPVNDEPEDPQKEVSDESAAGVDGDNVKVGDQITYEISYYNNYSEAKTVTIVDYLDDNVKLIDAKDKDGNSLYDTPVLGAVQLAYDDITGTVTWTFTAEAYESGTVSITVEVLEGAKTVHEVSNSASVQIGNDTAVTIDPETNPVDDDPVDPEKTEDGTAVSGLDASGNVSDTDNDGGINDETVTYGEVEVNDTITYTISYYNHYGEAADVTITDILDSGVTYVSSSNNGVYTSNTRTVTWTIENVAAYAEGTVTLTVKVNSTAKTITPGETEATVDNQATVIITEDDNTYENTTNVVVNPLKDDDPTDPTKTEVEVLDDSTGKTSTAHAADSVTEEDGTTYVTYGDVGVGDVITYQIDYTNHMNGIATITIEDVLDEGVDFVSATGESDADTIAANKDTTSNYVTYATTTNSEDRVTTVTWTIYNVDPYGTGTVTLKVKVNENAKTTEATETEATVENTASVQIGNESAVATNTVENPLEDDEPEAPAKTLTSVTDEDNVKQTATDAEGNLYVSVGDTVTYSITYYNNLNEVANVTITDVLDEGVDFHSATGVLEAEADNDDPIVYRLTYNNTGRVTAVTWTVRSVDPLTEDSVELTVLVNENAKTMSNGEDVASISNTASATVGNQSTYNSEPVTNELEPEDPVAPEKSVVEIDDVEIDNVDTDANTNTKTYTSSVDVGGIVDYAISYYNYNNTAATVTITDVLDAGVTYVEGSATQGGVYDKTTHTITWILTDVTPLTGGTVEFQVQVTSDAIDGTNTITNQANVKIGNEYNKDTNNTEVPVDDEPGTPTKTVSSEAGRDGDNVAVGDEITYTIGYYNNTSKTADVTITDELDDGFDFVSASGEDLTNGGTANGSVSYVLTTDANGKTTVTWTITDVEAYGTGNVTLTVKVNEKALVENKVTNEATVQVGNEPEVETDTTENPVDDEPVDPTKTETYIREDGKDAQETGDPTKNADETVYTYEDVAVDDDITYNISYYNHYGTAATITITDTLDDGVDFVSADYGGKYDSATRTVTWAIENVAAYSDGSVTLVVEVNKKAKTITTGETVATVENQVDVKITEDNGEYENNSNVVVNPLEDGEPTQPTKTVEIGDEDDTDDNGEEVAVDDTLTYTIGYTNHKNATAIITIVDELDDGVDFVEATGTDMTDGTATAEGNVTYVVNSSSGKTVVTWTITNVKPFATGSVDLVVTVNETAKETEATETEATVENDATVTNSEDPDNTVNITTKVVENPLEDDDPEAPVKTLTDETIESVSVGDEITYTISYYNNLNEVADVVITDVLDEGVTFVDASTGYMLSGNSVTYGGTVTWTIQNVAPLSGGTVTVTVKVNDKAKSSVNDYEDKLQQHTVTNEDGSTTTTNYTLIYGVTTTEIDEGTGEEITTTDTTASIVNQASAKVGHQSTYYSEPVETPLESEDPEAPTKELTSVTYADTTDVAATDDGTDTGNLYIHVGDTLTYTIGYYNNLNTTADVIITDVLDEGVTFVSLKDADGNVLDATYTSDTHTVTYTVKDVEPLTKGTVYLTVTVNDKAVASTNTYTLNQNTETTTTIDPDSGEEVTTTTDTTNYTLIYGVTTTYEDEVTGEKTSETDTTASIANQASTTVSSATVTNQATYYSVPVENPLEEEDPVDPVKTAETVEEEDVEPTVTEDSDGTEIHEYDTVSVGETVTYTISYYNHHNTKATITIEDPLDEGLTVYEDTITDGGVYDADKHTITWTLIVEPLSGGTVSFQAMVNENAKTINTAEETVATVENGATETNSEDVEIDREYKTNIVVHPIDPDDPSEPQKFVSTTSEAGVGGDSVSVGDQITYVITYYNHTNTTADVTIVDTLMDGVTFVDSDTVPYELGEDEDGLVTVTWTIADVAPYTGGTVNLTVEVGDEALTATQVENDADVTIGDNKYTTDLVVNPVDDVPQDPVKSVDVGDGETISAGDQLTYTITYYNNLGTAADVTITDKLDSDVTYVSSSDGGVYDSNTHTVTWTIEDVAAYTEDSVTLTVKVKSDATGTVKNIANVQIADGETQETVSDDDTNEVDNPISNTSTTTTSSKSSSPKTGDSFRLTLWVLLLAGSAAGLLALYFRRRNSDDAE